MWTQSKQAWSQLAEREQKLLSGLAVFLAGALLYLVIWLPIHNAYDNAIMAEQRAQQDWQWLSEQVAAHPMKDSGTPTIKTRTQSELMSTLQSRLRQQGLLSFMDSMTPTNKSIKVDFKAVEAPRLFAWLSTLEQLGLSSRQLQITRIKTGVVEASVQFEVAS